MPYIITFILTLFFAYINEKNLRKKKFIVYFSAFLVILIPAILAGIRDYTIGNDTYLTAVAPFKYSVSCSNFSELIKKYDVLEKGYLLLIFCVSRLFNDPHWLLFFISLINQTIIYVVLYKIKGRNSIFLGELIYLFVFYNASFNLIRQTMAMCFVLLAVVLFWENNKWKSLIFMGISLFFHKSAIIGFAYYPLTLLFNAKNQNYSLDKKRKNATLYYLKLIIMSIVIFSFFIGFERIASFIINTFFVGNNYSVYMSGQSAYISVYTCVCYFIFYIPILFKRNKSNLDFLFLAVALADMILYPLQLRMQWLYRISMYFMYFRIISGSTYRFNFGRLLKGKLNKGELWGMFIAISAIIYWFAFIVVWNNHNTYPYLFGF